MKVVPLGEIVQVKGGGTPRKSCPDFFGGQVPWVTPKDMKKWRISDSSVRLTLAGVENSPARIVEPGSVLVVVRSGVLKHTLPVALTTAAVTVNQDVKALTPTKEADAAYLARFIKWKQPTILGWVRATTADNFPIDKLLQLRVPLPALDEQRRIAALLDQASALRAKRRHALNHLYVLQQSIFLDMFGDPAANARGWELAALKDLSSVGGEYGANVPSIEYDPELPRYVRITDVTDLGQLTRGPKSPGGDRQNWQRYELREGDLLFARSGATVGKTYLHTSSNGPCVFAGYMIRFRLDEERVFPRFVFAFTKTSAYAKWVRGHQTVVAQPNINAKQYGNELLVPVPPMTLQRRFVSRVTSVDRLATAMAEAQLNGSELGSALHARFFPTGPA